MQKITKKKLLRVKLTMTRDEACKYLGISQGTYYKLLKKAGISIKDRTRKYELVEQSEEV